MCCRVQRHVHVHCSLHFFCVQRNFCGHKFLQIGFHSQNHKNLLSRKNFLLYSIMNRKGRGCLDSMVYCSPFYLHVATYMYVYVHKNAVPVHCAGPAVGDKRGHGG